jgi:hypothetical protein
MPLNDILNCPESELWSILDADESDDRECWFFCKGIGMIELALLGALLGVDSYDRLLADLRLVGEPRETGPWPQAIPAALIQRLATIGNTEIAAVVPRWLASEELAGTATTEELMDYLMQLRNFLADRSGDFFLINAL